MKLDDRYTDGIWYDTYNGDFAEIQESDDGERVELVEPENGDVYWDMPEDEWLVEQHEFSKVPEPAVNDPVEYVLQGHRILKRNSIEELAALPTSFEVGYRYACKQVEVREK